MDSLASPLHDLSEQGHITLTKKQLAAFAEGGFRTALDLLLLRPKKIIDKRTLVPIGSLLNKEGAQVQVEGTVIDAKAVRATRQFHISLQDNSGTVRIIWFHSLYLQKRFHIGMKLRCFGTVHGGYAPALLHPSYQSANKPLATKLEYQYSKIAGLSQKTIHKIIHQLLGYLSVCPPPQLINANENTVPLLRALHASENMQQLEQMRQALMHEEFIAHAAANQSANAPSINHFVLENGQAQTWLDTKSKQLDFVLTDDQIRAYSDMTRDMSQDTPMFRLLQGDVGCGKTIVAALVSGLICQQGWQACIIAPTTILAQQHYRYFYNLFGESYAIVLLTSQTSKAEKKQIQALIAEPKPIMVIATHAVLTGDMQFAALALVIADEQHRFGVYQRGALSHETARKPHQLLMTATPIPRTFFMSLRGDIAVSNIKQRPNGRKAIHTQCMSAEKRDTVMERVYRYCTEQNQQAYWVCTLIDDSEVEHHITAQQIYDSVTKRYPNCPATLLHGQMKESDKNAILQDVQAEKYKLVVATTVIEVGVHVEQAAIMIIENPERLGLAQLHQLRGRVGRGNQQAYCILLMGKQISKAAEQRLAYFADTEDGFLIAEYDFTNRGGGDIFGTKQSGFADFRLIEQYQDIHDCIKAQAKMTEPTREQKNQLVERWFGHGRLAYLGY